MTSSPATGGPRALRAGALALACVSLALAAHAAAGGSLPGPLALAAPVVVLGCVAALVTGRRLGRLATTGGLLLAQLALHWWLSVTSGGSCAVTAAMTGHVHGALTYCGDGAVATGSAMSAGPAVSTMSAMSAGSAVAMLAAHLLAVVLTGLLLAHGEALLWRLATLTPAGWRRVRALVAGPVLVVRLPSLVPVAPTALLSAATTGPERRRGPPRPLAAG